MQAKLFEIRDRGTFIPILAIKLSSESGVEHYLLSRAGYGSTPEKQAAYVLLAQISGGGIVQYSAHAWGDRTYRTAHKYIIEHFDELGSGSVVDVEYILGESDYPKVSEMTESLQERR